MCFITDPRLYRCTAGALIIKSGKKETVQPKDKHTVGGSALALKLN